MEYIIKMNVICFFFFFWMWPLDDFKSHIQLTLYFHWTVLVCDFPDKWWCSLFLNVLLIIPLGCHIHYGAVLSVKNDCLQIQNPSPWNFHLLALVLPPEYHRVSTLHSHPALLFVTGRLVSIVSYLIVHHRQDPVFALWPVADFWAIIFLYLMQNLTPCSSCEARGKI